MMFRQPDLSPLPEKNQYALLDDYPADYGNLKIVVPAGFVFDGASVPFFGWLPTYTPFHPDVMAPALIHDWLYLNHQVDREMADRIFYDLLILNGAGKLKAKLMYRGVRIGGGRHWPRGKKDIEKLSLLYGLCRKSDRFEDYCFPVDLLDQKTA